MIKSRIKYPSQLHCTGAPNMPPSVRAEGLKSKEETEDGSRLKLGSETQWKDVGHIQSMGRRDAPIACG